MSFNCCIFGASGYTGMELALLLAQHPKFNLEALYVSENSQDAGKYLPELNGRLPAFFTQDKLKLQALDMATAAAQAKLYDAVFLATPHEFSHDLVGLLEGSGNKVLDLSGAYRLKDTEVFTQYYGFPHTQETALSDAVYGLVEWHADSIAQANLIAVPGCYPTASLLALKPLAHANLLDATALPIINAVSGVSGAGRKATVNNSLCEVSLQAYGVLGHRHQPEIASQLGHDVIFTPHLGNFKRGILATITAKLSAGATAEMVEHAYVSAYANSGIVSLMPSWPKLDNLVGTPNCQLHWQFDPKSGYLVVTSAIDNLLKGAASQALQCANLMFGFDNQLGLLGDFS